MRKFLRKHLSDIQNIKFCTYLMMQNKLSEAQEILIPIPDWSPSSSKKTKLLATIKTKMNQTEADKKL